MKFVTDKSKGILGSPDSVELWTQIIDQIPDSLLLKPGLRILNIACGHCTEALILAKRMLALGIDPERVNESFTLLDKYQVFTNPARLLYGFENVITADFLTWRAANPMERFDIVLANPPYKRGLWLQFLKKSIEISNEFVCFISPDPSDIGSKFGDDMKSELIENGVQIKRDCSEFFPSIVSGKISYYVVNKNLPPNLDAFDESSISKIILKKMMKLNSKKLCAEYGNQDAKRIRDSNDYSVQSNEENPIPCLMSVTKTGMKIVYTEIAKSRRLERVLVTNRYFGLTSDDPIFVIDDFSEYIASYNIIIIPTECSVENFKSLYLSKLYRFVYQIRRNGNMDIQSRYLNELPMLDLTRTWTDAEIYEYFDLTAEEIEYVESNVK